MRRVHWEADLSVQTGTGHSITIRGDSSASIVEITGPGGIGSLKKLAESSGGLLQFRELLAYFVIDGCSIRFSGTEVAKILATNTPGLASRLLNIPGLHLHLLPLGLALFSQK